MTEWELAGLVAREMGKTSYYLELEARHRHLSVVA